MDELFWQGTIYKVILHIAFGEFYFSGHFAVRILNVHLFPNNW